MPRSWTPTVPRKPCLSGFSVLASVTLTRGRLHLYYNDADIASGMCVSPVAYVVLCVRFAPLVHVCRSCNRLQRSAKDATLDTGGWLDLARQGLSPC
ncbi:MAG: hypothetical protein ABL933_15370 [Methyloglobulus sp.]